MSLFGSAFGTSTQQPQSSGLFGSTNTTAQTQQSGGLFGGQNNQSGGGLFGSTNQQNQNQNQPNAGGSMFGGTQNNQQNQGGGLFGNTQNQQQNQGGGLFGGQTQQNNQQSGGLFGGLGQNQNQNQQQGQAQGGLFGNSTQQPQQQQGGLFSNSVQNPMAQSQQTQLGSSLWTPNSGVNPREKSVPEQISLVLEKWDVANPNCAFKYYFYNKVGEEMAPYYRPTPQEDPRAWEDALSKKPGPGFIPVLCTGFQQIGERIKLQQRHIAEYNKRLHEINDSLTQMLQTHDTKTSIRAMDARRKHNVLKNRCLALATKVQILRNRGYAMGGDEEDLKNKLQALDRSVCDPGLGARAEEIWARMITVQERAKLLQRELEKTGAESHTVLDEEMTRRAKKILEDYQTQLMHLKKELDSINEAYSEWEREQGPPTKRTASR